MKPLSREEKKKALKAAFWDMQVDTDLLLKALESGKEKDFPMDKTRFYSRLLNTYDWYILLKLIPKKNLSDALKRDVIKLLWPKSIQNRYIYASSILFR